MKSSSKQERQKHYSDYKNKDFLFDAVKRCQDGDSEAMESVFTAYKTSLLNLAFRFTGDFSLAEDLLQDIFIKIFTNIKGLRCYEAFNTWIYRIAVNTCVSFRRKTRKTKEVSLVEIENAGQTEDDRSQVKQQLEQAIKILPSRQKMVFLLHDVQGFTHTEIAKIMKISEGSAKSQLFKARMKIRNLLRSL